LPWLAAQASWAGWQRWLALCCGWLAACAVWLFSCAVLLRRVTGRVAAQTDAQTFRADYCANWLHRLSGLAGCAVLAGYAGWLCRFTEQVVSALWLRQLGGWLRWLRGWLACRLRWMADSLAGCSGSLAPLRGWLRCLAFRSCLMAAWLADCFTECLAGWLPGCHPAYLAGWLPACLPSCWAA